MYLAMKNLAEYIASDERDDPKEIWKDWKEKYKPLPDTVNTLKEMCTQLCKIDKEENKNRVNEKKYKSKVESLSSFIKVKKSSLKK